MWLSCSSICWSTDLFQSTHPRRVWRVEGNSPSIITWFQSTHPRRVWLIAFQPFYELIKFQSTHPRRVWQSKNRIILWEDVSIHTPTQGVTLRKSIHLFSEAFQSTHPRRVWHNSGGITIMDLGFNPHTHAGCDQALRFRIIHYVRFNPHTHAGCDDEDRYTLRCEWSFNPHTHAGCDTRHI